LWLRPHPGSDGTLALGLAHLLIESGRYDDTFLTRWSDAPFLVAEDDGRLLSGADLSADGDSEQRVVWNEATGTMQLCPSRPPNAATETRLALRGRYTVQTLRGAITCRPVFERLAERCRAWPTARVAESPASPLSRSRRRRT
jgi:anaerobic selenocysteine-containing dehydrogenase